MKLIDNTNYKDIYDGFLHKAGKIEDEKNNNLVISMFASFFSIAFLAMAIASIVEINANIEAGPELLVPILCFIFSVIFLTFTASFVVYMMHEYNSNLDFIVEFRKVIAEIDELDVRSKLIKISKTLGSSHIDYLNVERIDNDLEFLNYDVTKAILDTKNKSLSVTYFKNGEAIDKKICCNVRYFEDLDEPAITVDKNKISLSLKYEVKSLEVIDLTSYF